MNPSFAFLALILLPFAAYAQTTTGNLEGRVVDTSGAPMPGVNVTVSSEVLQGTRGCTTDVAGYFRLSALPPGTYSVKMAHITSRSLTVDQVHILLGRTTSTGETMMRPRDIELPGLEITETRPQIDPRSTVTGVNLTNTRFDVLPIDRNYMSMVQLSPQSTPSFYGDGPNIAGATGIENRYFINGADVTDAYRGVSGAQLPYNFVREVQIRTGAYEAEYPSSLGGIVNVVTYSGGNDFHGQVFGFYTNSRFSASPRMAVGKPAQGDFAQYDAGVSLGGPIVRDRLWYFIAYNPQIQRETVPVMGQPDQNDRSTAHIFASKLTWSANESHMLSLSVMGDPTFRRGVGVSFFNGEMSPMIVNDLNAWLSDSRTGTTSMVVDGTHIITSAILLESSLSYSSRVDEYNPVGHSEPYTYADLTNNSISGTFNRTYEKTATIHAGLRGTMTLGNHTVKAGLEYSGFFYTAQDRWTYLIRLSETDFLDELRVFSGDVSSRNPSLFVQNSWQVSTRMTLNGGIRWDPQFMIASDGTLAQEIAGTVAPRFGIVFQPGSLGSERLTASAGRFYQPLSLNLSVTYHNKGVQSVDIFYPHDPRVDTSGAFRPPGSYANFGNVSGLHGQYYDEFTLGYEREWSSCLKAGVRLVYRRLGEAVEDAYSSNAGRYVYGNPGSVPLEEYPRARREYGSLELSIERNDPLGFNFLASYTLSRSYGNYEGLADVTYSSSTGGVERWPNTSLTYWYPSAMNKALGLLPGDRTHMFKFFCSYPLFSGLTIGASGYWTSGTPLNELGTSPPPELIPIFLQTRGSSGRTPSIWDANLRLVYDLGDAMQTTWRPRLILDVFHLFSQRVAVQYEQQHYWYAEADGTQSTPNANYAVPLQFQPPMSMRLGIEMNF